MAEEKEAKVTPASKPLDKRKRICGRWRHPDYKASKEEQAEYKRRQEIGAARKRDIAKVGKK